MGDELLTFFSKPAGAFLMTKTIKLNLKLDYRIRLYVDFLINELKAGRDATGRSLAAFLQPL